MGVDQPPQRSTLAHQEGSRGAERRFPAHWWAKPCSPYGWAAEARLAHVGASVGPLCSIRSSETASETAGETLSGPEAAEPSSDR